jgi:hypothetical protein
MRRGGREDAADGRVTQGLPGSLSTRVFCFFRSHVTKTLLIGLDGEADSGLVLGTMNRIGVIEK